jgi:hypothetical protein
MKTLNEYPVEWVGKLVHMLGAGPEIKRKERGYRNRFYAAYGSNDFETLKEMETAGLVIAGRIDEASHGRRFQWFSATKAGCVAAGLHPAAIKRALE